MKQYLLFHLAFAMIFTLSAQAQDFSWAKTGGGSSLDFGYDVAMDNNGNVYAVGYFQGTATFGEGASAVDLVSAGLRDAYIAKYDPSGSLLWAKRAGGTGNDEGVGAGADINGSSYVSGTFEGTATFGEGTNQVNLTSAGGSDAYLAKYSATGDLEWVVQGTSSGTVFNWALATDDSGNSYLTGSYLGSVTFGGVSLTTGGTQAVYVVKYNSAGTLQWAKTETSSSDIVGRGIGLDASGNVLVTGYFFGTASFNGGALQVPSDEEDAFITKYNNADGSFQWVQVIYGRFDQRGYGVQGGANGDVYVAGRFEYEGIFFSLNNTDVDTITNDGSWDIFVGKYNSNGDLRWATQSSGSGNNIVYDMAIDGQDNIYMSGRYFGTVNFENSAISLSNSGNNDMLALKYDSSGVLAWAKNSQSTGSEEGWGVDVNDAGTEIAVTGYLSGATDFDAITVNTVGSLDVFVAKIAEAVDCSAFPSPTITQVGNDTLISSSAGSYQWLKNDTAIAGATDSVHVVTETGYYQVTVTGGGCTATSDSVYIEIVGIKEINKNNFIRVYPNPVHASDLSVEIDRELLKNENIVLKITDVTGRVIIKDVVNKYLTSYNLDDYNSGVYFVNLNGGEYSYSFKIVKY